MPKVMYAQFYAVQAQDRELYQKLLNEVIQADPNALPDQILANKLAQGRANVPLQQLVRRSLCHIYTNLYEMLQKNKYAEQA
ncbi:MAG: hypothetical protein A2051_08485 [Desulfovibrionales bacterium GWA2_65_9]|nr:MAG: hypothetical protein A2051_08485 [Desulfovibrionales bacterium GWA2_65_9]